MNDILFGNNNKAVIKKLANAVFAVQNAECDCSHCDCPDNFSLYGSPDHWHGCQWDAGIQHGKNDGIICGCSGTGTFRGSAPAVKENAMFEKVGCWIPVEIMTNTNRRVAEVDYADQTQLEIRMLTPRTGSAPQKANEVLVSANILKDLNIEGKKLGRKFLSNFKNRSKADQMYHF